MKYVLLSIIMLFTLNLNVSANKNTPKIFIEKHDSIAYSLSEEFKIPTSIILAISLFESGNGNSQLSRKKKNYFGIKKGKYYRSYKTDEESFRHFCEVISRKKYYKQLINNDVTDYKKWIYKIQSGGYSQTSTWSNSVINIIHRYDLNKLDK